MYTECDDEADNIDNTHNKWDIKEPQVSQALRMSGNVASLRFHSGPTNTDRGFHMVAYAVREGEEQYYKYAIELSLEIHSSPFRLALFSTFSL